MEMNVVDYIFIDPGRDRATQQWNYLALLLRYYTYVQRLQQSPIVVPALRAFILAKLHILQYAHRQYGMNPEAELWRHYLEISCRQPYSPCTCFGATSDLYAKNKGKSKLRIGGPYLEGAGQEELDMCCHCATCSPGRWTGGPGWDPREEDRVYGWLEQLLDRLGGGTNLHGDTCLCQTCCGSIYYKWLAAVRTDTWEECHKWWTLLTWVQARHGREQGSWPRECTCQCEVCGTNTIRKGRGGSSSRCV